MRAKFGRGPTVVSKKGSLKFISRLVCITGYCLNVSFKKERSSEMDSTIDVKNAFSAFSRTFAQMTNDSDKQTFSDLRSLIRTTIQLHMPTMTNK